MSAEATQKKNAAGILIEACRQPSCKRQSRAPCCPNTRRQASCGLTLVIVQKPAEA
jgi:hypothetical protein